MPLLSRFLALQQASPLAALTQPQTTPQMGFEWQNPSMLPQTAQIPPGALSISPNKQATPGEGTPPGGWMSRLQSGMESPLFNIGMALMAGSQNGGDWSMVSDTLRGYGQDQRERQRLANEERAAKAQQNLQNTQFDWMRTDRQRADEQRQRYTDWAGRQSDNPDASVDPEAAFTATQEARGIATQPITPYQQAQLDMQNRQFSQEMGMRARALEIDAARANIERPLRGPDAQLMDQVRESAARGQALNMLGEEFLRANGTNGTGEMSRYNPANFWDSNRAAMRAASAQMRSYMRPAGSGATSDYEQRIYAMGVPSTDNTGPQNQAIMRYHQAASQLAQGRRYFYEDYARQYGTLNGAEQAFQQSHAFQSVTSAAPLPQTQQAPAAQRQPSQAPEQTGAITPEQARAEMRRRESLRRQNSAYGQQPGGYTGR